MADAHCRCIPKATNTLSKCVILIVFPLQQWLHEHISVLHSTYVACLVQTNRVFVEIRGSYSGAA